MRTLLAISLAAACTACGGTDHQSSHDAAEDPCATINGEGLFVSSAWVRAVPEASQMSAAYFDLCNATDDDDTLLGVTTAAAAISEIHETTRDENGVASMAPVDGVPLPAGETAHLAPGGYHVMLMQLSGPIAADDTVLLTLQFEKAAPVTIEAETRAMGDTHNH